MTKIKNITMDSSVLTEGDDIPITFTFTDSAGAAFDLSGVTKVWFTVKSSVHDTNDDAIIGPLDSDTHPAQVTYGAPTPGAGKVEVILLNTETVDLATYPTLYYDLQWTISGLNRTPVKGQISFDHEVTLGTP